KDTAFELEFFSQNILQPDSRETDRIAINYWINQMCRHDATQSKTDHATERHHIFHLNVGIGSPIDRLFQMRICSNITMPRKMLTYSLHPSCFKSQHEIMRQFGDCLRIAMKSTVTYNAALSIVDIKNGCKTQVNTTGLQLCRQHKSNLFG